MAQEPLLIVHSSVFKTIQPGKMIYEPDGFNGESGLGSYQEGYKRRNTETKALWVVAPVPIAIGTRG